MATLSPGAGRRPTSRKSHARSFTAVPPVRSDVSLVKSVSRPTARDDSSPGACLEASEVRRSGGRGACCRRWPCSRPTRGPGSPRPCRSGRASRRDLLRGRQGKPRPPHGRRALRLPGDLMVDPAPTSDLYLDLAVLGDHLVGAECDVRVGQASSGRHVIFEAVPGAGHDLTLTHPLELPVPLGVGYERTQSGLALAQRSRLVRADVGKAVELTADVEDPDLTPPDLHDPVSSNGELREIADDVFFALRAHRRLMRLPLGSMLKSLRAFSPKTLRLTSFVKGIWCTF